MEGRGSERGRGWHRKVNHVAYVERFLLLVRRYRCVHIQHTGCRQGDLSPIPVLKLLLKMLFEPSQKRTANEASEAVYVTC